jgi:hypothetical protein
MIKQCIYAVFIVVLFAGSACADIWQSLEEGDVKAVRDELAKGIDVNSQATDGRTLLIHALYSDQVDVAKMLIAQGADVKKAVERTSCKGRRRCTGQEMRTRQNASCARSKCQCQRC